MPTLTLDPDCNRAAFVEDVTVPDGTIINATEKFIKTWRFENIGTCTWTTSYKFVFISGDRMGARDSISLSKSVAPNETIDISINLTAPNIPGEYKGVWSFEDNNSKRFGLGISSTGEIWVQVEVISLPTSTPILTSTPTQVSVPTLTSIPTQVSTSTLTSTATQVSVPTSTSMPTQASTPTVVPPFVVNPADAFVYDLMGEICSAQWLNGNGAQPCPGSSDETQGAINIITIPTLEDGSTLNYPAIALNPDGANGFVRGIYPEYLVQPGDHFRAIASCEADATTCSALFRISYQDISGNIVDLWVVGEFYDQTYSKIDLDLSSIAGQKVKFILDVTFLNNDPNARVIWAAPGIYRQPQPTATPTLAPVPTETSTPTLTATPVPSPTPTPLPATQPSAWDKFQQFINDLFQKLFGG